MALWGGPHYLTIPASPHTHCAGATKASWLFHHARHAPTSETVYLFHMPATCLFQKFTWLISSLPLVLSELSTFLETSSLTILFEIAPTQNTFCAPFPAFIFQNNTASFCTILVWFGFFACFYPLEYRFHQDKNFLLFHSLPYLQHSEQCLAIINIRPRTESHNNSHYQKDKEYFSIEEHGRSLHPTCEPRKVYWKKVIICDETWRITRC